MSVETKGKTLKDVTDKTDHIPKSRAWMLDIKDDKGRPVTSVTLEDSTIVLGFD